MNGNEHLRQTLEYYRQQRQKKIEEIKPIDAMIRHLEKELGEGSGEVSDFSQIPELEPSEIGFPKSTFGVAVRPDEFFGMSQSDAAKAYLKKVARAVSLDQLVDSLNKGGAQVGGANPKHTLYVSLMRNPLREFVSPSENYIGLREFYPSLPRATKPAWGKKGKPKKVKRGNGQKARKTRSAKTKAEPKSEAKSSSTGVSTDKRENIGAVVREVMRDGKPRTKEDIFKAVETKVGHPIAQIAVYGTLRGKGFSADESGKISLVQ